MVPQNGWFIMDNPIKMDDLGVAGPRFLTDHSGYSVDSIARFDSFGACHV